MTILSPIKSKNTLLLFFLIAISIKSFSQQEVKLFYNAQWEITNPEFASYIRKASYDLNNFKLDGKVIDTDTQGNIIGEGEYTKGKRNGYFKWYYKNGQVKKEGEIVNNRMTGTWRYYYWSGQLKQVILIKKGNINNNFVVTEFYDKSGEQLISNGTGKWMVDSVKYNLFSHDCICRLHGTFKDSVMHGTWKAVRISDGKLIHSEQYRKGKYISGINNSGFSNDYGVPTSALLPKSPFNNHSHFTKAEKFILDEIAFPTTLVENDVETIFSTVTGVKVEIKNRPAGFKYGDYQLMSFIGQNLNYPIGALSKGISGKVYVSFTIDSNGQAKDYVVIRGVEESLDKEALRVVKLTKDWLPKITNGEPVESKLTIPVNFVRK